MTVIRPNSISGITSLTAHRGSIDFYAHDGSAARFDNVNSNVTSGVSTFASLNITGDLDVGGVLTYEDVTNIDSIGVVTARSGIRVTDGSVGIGTDNPENRISVFNSGYTGLELQSNRTTATDNIGGVHWKTQSTNVAYLQSLVDGTVRIRNTSSLTERLRIKSDGNVGINDTDPRTGLTINKYGTAPTTNGNTYSMPAGRWVSTWNTSTSNNVDYWAGFGGGGYAVSSGSVNIALASNHNNTSQQAGMYIAGEATSASSADFTIGKLISGSAIGSSDVAGNQRATKSELMRVTSAGLVGINCTPLAQLQVKAGTNQNIALSSMSSEAAIEAFNDAGSANVPLRLRASVHKFFIGSTEGLRVHTNGLIGVGHDSPTAYGRMTVAMPSQSGGAAIQVANSSNGSGDGTTSNIVLRSVNNSANQWADAEYRASQHIFAIQGTERLRITSDGTSKFQPTMGVGARNIRIWANTAGSYWRSFIGTNLDWDGSNFYKNSDNGSNNWGNVAGITFDGGNVSNEVAIRFLTDLPSGSSNFPNNLGSAESVITSRTAGYFDTAGRLHLDNQPCAMAYNAQGQHMGGGSIAQFNSTRFNIGNMYNSSNGRMTAPVAGRYLVAYSGLHDYNSQSSIGFDIRINGSVFNGGEGYQSRNGTPLANSQLSKTLILSLSANDYVDIYIRSSGTQVHQRYGSFSMSLIT